MSIKIDPEKVMVALKKPVMLPSLSADVAKYLAEHLFGLARSEDERALWGKPSLYAGQNSGGGYDVLVVEYPKTKADGGNPVWYIRLLEPEEVGDDEDLVKSKKISMQISVPSMKIDNKFVKWSKGMLLARIYSYLKECGNPVEGEEQGREQEENRPPEGPSTEVPGSDLTSADGLK